MDSTESKMRDGMFTKIALLVVMLFGWISLANAEDDPRTVIESTVSSMIEVLKARKDETILTESDRIKIRNIVSGRFDYSEMAQRSLGDTWKSISDQQRSDFTNLFSRLLERSYGNRLASFRDQKVEYGNAQYKGDKARVKTRVIDATKETPVEYRLHQTSTGWQVYDIKIEGVSLISNFYNDFQEGIRQYGGFEGLVQALENKVEKLEARDEA